MTKMRAFCRRPGAVFCLALLLVLATGLLVPGRDGREGVVPGGALDLPALLPARTLAFVSVDGGPCVESGGQLALGRLGSDPGAAAFLAPLREWLDRGLADEGDRIRSLTGLSPPEWIALLKGRISVALVGVVAGERPDGGPRSRRLVPDAVVAIELGKDLDAVRSLVQALETMVLAWGPGTFSDDSVAGRSVRKFEPPAGTGFPAWYLVHETSLLLATSRATLEGILTRLKSGSTGDTLGSTERWAAVRRETGGAGTVASVFVNSGEALATLGKELPEDALLLAEGSGLDRVEALGYALAIDPPGFRDRFYVHLPAGGPLADAFRAGPAPSRLPDLLPAGTGLLASGRVSGDRLAKWALAVAESVGAGPIVEGALESAGGMTGADLLEGILPGLGPEIGFFAAWPGQALIPDFGLLIEVKDPAVVQAALDHLAGALGLKTGRVEGEEGLVRYMEIGGASGENESGRRRSGPGLTFRPAWAFVDGFLLVTAWPQAARHFLASRAPAAPKLSSREDFAAGLARLRERRPAAGSAGLAYADLGGLAGFVLDNGIPLAQSLLGAEVPLDFAAIPVTPALLPHVFGPVAGGAWTDQGWALEGWSPTGFVPPLAVAGLAAAWFQVREAAPASPDGGEGGREEVEPPRRPGAPGEAPGSREGRK